jgi:hypothetical protein
MLSCLVGSASVFGRLRSGACIRRLHLTLSIARWAYCRNNPEAGCVNNATPEDATSRVVLSG